MSKSRFLVTGGAGFIGSNIVEELLKRGEEVRVLDNFSFGKRKNLDFASHYPFELIEGDIRDLDTCHKACKEIDYVLHQAALRSVPRSIDHPGCTNEVNVKGTLNILLAARDAKVKRVVYASSSSVYGNALQLPLNEKHLPVPISPYAASKLAGEQYCRVFSEIYELETVSLRYFNVFGPRQSVESEYAVVIPKFIQQALLGEPLEVHGDGEQTRDFSYVANVVKANLLAAKTSGIRGKVFNIACGERHSVLKVGKTVGEILKKEISYNYTPARKGDVKHTLADITQARDLLEYTVVVGFEEGMKRTIEYFEKAS
ncbi:MAG: SDR family oxidoreductase [Thermodesulfobacteriota bacterium]|nr:SDR family oxidoreductase [Thermodesulfobacteriota bacterium]